MMYKAVSAQRAKEKNIRHGHISTLHIWWARRPLVVSRATIYASLIPAPKNKEERIAKEQFIAIFSDEYKKWLGSGKGKQLSNILHYTCLAKWENSLNKKIIERARKEILKANGGKPPKVLDPFADGGSIPQAKVAVFVGTHADVVHGKTPTPFSPAPKTLPTTLQFKARIPWDKLHTIIAGIITPLKDKGAEPEITLEIKAHTSTGLDRTTLDAKIKETLLQIGAKIEEWNEE